MTWNATPNGSWSSPSLSTPDVPNSMMTGLSSGCRSNVMRNQDVGQSREQSVGRSSQCKSRGKRRGVVESLWFVSSLQVVLLFVVLLKGSSNERWVNLEGGEGGPITGRDGQLSGSSAPLSSRQLQARVLQTAGLAWLPLSLKWITCDSCHEPPPLEVPLVSIVLILSVSFTRVDSI